MILPIYLYGQPVLRKVAEPIDKDYPELQTLIANMFETMYNADGVGLAAPQVGLAIRLIVIDLDVYSDETPEFKGLRKVLINPQILERSGDVQSVEEGCLSLPGIHESVPREGKIHVTYYDENWNFYDERIEGFFARVIQHEYDHVEGHVFVDRISPIRRQLIKSKLDKLAKGKTDCRYKVK